MINKRFGRLTVIEELDKRTSNGSKVYLCKCDCGNLKEVTGGHLRGGSTKSCGCLNRKFKEMPNQRFGRLILTSEVKRVNRRTHYLCKCDCGNEKWVYRISLIDGSIKSCGCLNTEVRKATLKKRMKLVDGTSLVSISESRKINKNNTSGVKGVSWSKSKQKWVAQIMFKGKTIGLGRFDDFNEAVEARKKAEDVYFKTFIKMQEN